MTKYFTEILPIEPHHFVNVYVWDIEDGNESRDMSVDEYTEALSCDSGIIPTGPESGSELFFDGFHPDLFDYYSSRLCALTSPSKHTTSPFTQLILPLFTAGGQEFVLQSIMAFAARHRSVSNPHYARMALSLKGKALASLRRRLTAPNNMTTLDIIADPQIPIAMMFLCLDEILDNCDHRWVIHLRACQDWLKRRKQFLLTYTPNGSSLRQQHQHQQHSLVSFAERFFAFQDVISRTACGKAPHFGLEYWQSPERESDTQGWMGCSPALASIIFRTTELGRARELNELSAHDFERQAASLEEELESLRYRGDFSVGSGQGNTYRDAVAINDDGILHDSFELMREAVQLYHHCLLHDASPSTPLVAESVRSILRKTHRLVQAGSTSGLAFPLFAAAVELDPLDDELIPSDISDQHSKPVSGRRLVLEILQTLTGSSLFNVAKTRAVIRNIWTMRDLHLGEPQEEMGEQNDWNIYVSPYCNNLNLA
ncbi:hypothetical protein jhhlp_008184 [Lomentospora prolificans]|uniref:Uncharacterized protein n=1 Tax=Lomentospora prolificans TaxID=41688 RepID=A0A2N3MZT3_9PEZI|nr:hypothetical protein jhhlp_008184 [Lomentospora prolificans]